MPCTSLAHLPGHSRPAVEQAVRHENNQLIKTGGEKAVAAVIRMPARPLWGHCCGTRMPWDLRRITDAYIRHWAASHADPTVASAKHRTMDGQVIVASINEKKSQVQRRR